MLDDDVSREMAKEMPQCRFVHHKFHITWHGLRPKQLQWEAHDQLPHLWHSFD
jgi:hypothetical protein